MAQGRDERSLPRRGPGPPARGSPAAVGSVPLLTSSPCDVSSVFLPCHVESGSFLRARVSFHPYFFYPSTRFLCVGGM